jgi:hypothetical protein
VLDNVVVALTRAIASSADRLEAAERTRLFIGVASILTSSLERKNDDVERSWLVSSLALLVSHLGPSDVSPICEKAIGILLRARQEDPKHRGWMDGMIATLLAKLEPQVAQERASQLCTLLVGESNKPGYYYGQGGIRKRRGVGMGMMGVMNREIQPEEYPESLNLFLSDNGPAQIRLRAKRMASLAGPGLEGALEAAARVSAEPFPCRLTTQQLVDLLKMPTCFGAARRVVLDHLGNRYGRRFVNHWAFVRYATEQKLNIDFTTPPQRPQTVR